MSTEAKAAESQDRNLMDSAQILVELCDTDELFRAAVLDNCGVELRVFSQSLASAYRIYADLSAAVSRRPSRQSEWVLAFVHGIIEDLLTSTKLLLAGKLPASGNIFRQAIESYSMAQLCASDIVFPVKGKSPRKIQYWQAVEEQIPLARGGDAFRLVQAHALDIGIHMGQLSALETYIKHLHGWSHAGKKVVLSRIRQMEQGKLRLGGKFNPEDAAIYQQQIYMRSEFSRYVIFLVWGVSDRLKLDMPSMHEGEAGSFSDIVELERRRASWGRCSGGIVS